MDGDEVVVIKDFWLYLCEYVVWECNMVWRELIGLER